MSGQTFEAQQLDPTIDFADVSKNVVIMIHGKGRMVFWEGCNVTVYDKDAEGKPRTTRLHEMRNGQGQILIGTKLYITDGKVKEA
jgi:hypothetical protein